MEKKQIIFRLSRPFKVSRTAAVDRVQLPAVNGDITILPNRAPILLLLRNGLLQVLDKDGKPTERYFVKGGIADVARNRCAVSSEKVVAFDKIDVIKNPLNILVFFHHADIAETCRQRGEEHGYKGIYSRANHDVIGI